MGTPDTQLCSQLLQLYTFSMREPWPHFENKEGSPQRGASGWLCLSKNPPSRSLSLLAVQTTYQYTSRQLQHINIFIFDTGVTYCKPLMFSPSEGRGHRSVALRPVYVVPRIKPRVCTCEASSLSSELHPRPLSERSSSTFTKYLA